MLVGINLSQKTGCEDTQIHVRGEIVAESGFAVNSATPRSLLHAPQVMLARHPCRLAKSYHQRPVKGP